jgi:REP-associated tyrosine transposase
MGRTLRFAPADGSFHITARGNRRQPIVVDDTDRSWLVALVADVVERFDWRCLAYCLMTNHYHLVVHTPKPTLSAGMQRLNGVWAQRFNWRHGFEGHLFERPFRSTFADTDEQLMEFVRYTVLNPVRAGIHDKPGDWPWSSYRAAAGHVPPPRFLDVKRLYELFEEPGRDGRSSFVEFVANGIDSSGGVLGRVLGPGPETRLLGTVAATPGRARLRRADVGARRRPARGRVPRS